MRITKIVLTCVCLIGIALPGFAQQKASGILGHLDPATGAFTPARVTPVESPESAMVAPVVYGGELVVNFTIAVKSTLPTTSVLTCTLHAHVVDNYAANIIMESASAAATRSGSTAKCSVTLPYSWSLATAPSDSVGITYEILATSAGTATTLGGQLLRSTDQGLGSIALPLNGATTTKSVAVTI